MSLAFKAFYIEEPDLVFGYKREEKDPRIGLKYHGPYFFESDAGPTPSRVNVGIIGDATTLTQTKVILEALTNPIPSLSTNKWLYPDFPGFNLSTSIRCEFKTNHLWEVALTEAEIKRVIDISDAGQRITAGVNLFRDAVDKIHDENPNVIICALPDLIEQRCGISPWTRGAKTPKFTELEELAAAMAKEDQSLLDEWGFSPNDEAKEPVRPQTDLDFHNALKGKTMKFDIPVQLLRYSTIRGFSDYGKTKRDVQEPATIAWNIGTALYYKANGKPWRLAKLRESDCYVGISFFKNKRNPDPDIQTSMAQVFTHSGEGIVLRGSEVVKDKARGEAHMSEKQAFGLMKDALEKYEGKQHHAPGRVVIHKTSSFSQDEMKGFNEAIGEKTLRDYVTIYRRNDYRFLRTGSYPVLRGTMIMVAHDKCLLYTSGYIPRVRTYPGSRIPEPLAIIRIGDSELTQICSEIMGLTKLNWNTTAFATSMPITVAFSASVGKVLGELDDDKDIKDHYRFYM